MYVYNKCIESNDVKTPNLKCDQKTVFFFLVLLIIASQ